MTRLKEQYKSKALPELLEELDKDNVHAAPRLRRIVLNAGIGRLLQENPKALDEIKEQMREIAGQQPQVTRAKKAVSAFKVREGQVVGLIVTLRGRRMYEFFDKMVNSALPRIRDFRGFSRKGFDGKGNYSLGLKEHTVFPEMAATDPEATFGMEVTIVTSAENDKQGYALLKKLGFPFND